MADPIVNFFKSTLVGTYSNSATSLTIATGDGALLPDPSVDGAFNLTIFEGLQVTNSTSFEIVRVTARSGDVLTVTRGAENTTPLTISSSTHSILMSATKKTFDDINTAIDNVNVTDLTGVESLVFDSTGDEEFGLPVGTTAQRPASPSAGYMRWNSTDSRIEVYNGTRWAGLSEIGLQQETMEVAQLSVTANDAVAENVIPLEVEYLVIAGGGGGGGSNGGGGGAGGYRSSVVGEDSGGGASAESILELDVSTNYTVTVGGGGSGGVLASSASTNGSNSVFSTITSTGGGNGGDETFSSGSGGTGGSGGGQNGFTSGGTFGSGTTNQGYDGGVGRALQNSPYLAGGGGGAGQVGQDFSGTICGDGGDGVQSSITGSATYRAGGGGGGGWFSGATSAGSGGLGGGGNGTLAQNAVGSNATINTGGGGGGSGNGSGVGGSGGSGVVILRYPSSFSITIGAGLTGSETTDGSDKYAVITAGTGNVSWSEA